MKKIFLKATALFAALTPALSQAELLITKEIELNYQEASADYFTGKARFARYPTVDESKDGWAIVEFDTGVVNNWHSHTKGQYIIVTEGVAWVQEWGKEIQELKKGDVAYFPPNVKHWHGAAAGHKMAHITISPDRESNKTIWLEKVALPKVDSQTDLQKISQIEPLADKQLAIVPIALLSSLGDLERLKPALENGLKAGLTVAELKEIFAHQYAYAGFPRALNGLITLNKLLEEREKAGIQDEQGVPPNPVKDTDYYTVGTEFLNTMSQRDNSAELWGFEGIDYALKAHLFGYLFSRDNFSPVNRELVTVSTIAGLKTAQSQLKSHLGHVHRLGVSKADLQKVMAEIAKADKEVAESATQVLDEAVK